MWKKVTKVVSLIYMIKSNISQVVSVSAQNFPIGAFLHINNFSFLNIVVFCVCPITADEDAFTIQHSSTGKCLGTGASSDLSLTSCDPSAESQLWKWGSAHRLFHVATSLCLALEVRSKTLSLVDCGANILLWWRCLDGAVYTVYEMALVVNDSKVSTKRDTTDTWLRGGSGDNICQKPYRGECGFSYILSERENAYILRVWLLQKVLQAVHYAALRTDKCLKKLWVRKWK